MHLISKMAVDYSSSTKFRQDWYVNFDYLLTLKMRIANYNYESQSWYLVATVTAGSAE